MKREGPAIYLSDLPRTWTRATWLAFYALMRISARESRKAFDDMIIHGVAIVQYSESNRDFVRHVPHDEYFR